MRFLPALIMLTLAMGCLQQPAGPRAAGSISSCLSVCDLGFGGDDAGLQGCKDRCYFDEGKRSGEARWCAGISDGELADGCISLAAEKAGDAAMCGKCRDPSYRLNCIRGVAVASGDPVVCNLIVGDEEFRDSCISWVAGARKDSSICSSISSADFRAQCVNSAK